jgi:maltoporin
VDKLRNGLLLGVACAALGSQSAIAQDYVAENFEFGGYLRAGTGANGEGGDQVCFQAPGAGSKYRLGNECEVYSELAFRYVAWQDDNSDAFFKLNTLLAFVVPGQQDFETTSPAFRTAWVQGTSLFGGALEGSTFWAGKRFYMRNDIHINDFFYWGGGASIGGGIEDVDVGIGKFAYAWLTNTADETSDFLAPVVDEDGTPVDVNGNPVFVDIGGAQVVVNDRSLQRHDFRWYGIPVNPGGSLDLGFDYRMSSESQAGFDGEDGFMVNVQHFQEISSIKGWNKGAIQYGQGAAANLQDFGNDEQNSDNETWRFVNQTVVGADEALSNWSAMLAIVYEDRDWEPEFGGDQKWFSIGVRPIYHFSQFVHLALELGYDQVEPEVGDTRKLTKFTIAPFLARNKGFFKRPDIRAFFTYADWNDAAQEAGVITSGESPFGDDTDGWTYGVQTEMWW